MSNAYRKLVALTVMLVAILVAIGLRREYLHDARAREHSAAAARAALPLEESPAAKLVQPSLPLVPPDPAVAGTTTASWVGRVVDHETDRPIEGASITLTTAFATPSATSVSVVSGVDGTFRIKAPISDDGRLTLSAPGHARLTSSLTALDDDQVRTRAGDLVRLRTLRLHRGVQPVVHVLDAAGRPVANAELRLFESTPYSVASSARDLGRTDERGQWTAQEPIAGATLSTYLVAVTDDGLGFTPLASLAEGSRGEPIDVVLKSSLVFDVLVRDTNGAPLAAVALDARLQRTPYDDLRSITSAVSRASSGWVRATTNAEGKARIRVPDASNDPEGWIVCAQRPDFEAAHAPVLESGSTRFATVVMKARAVALVHTAVGSVLDPQGKPVTDSVVRFGASSCAPDRRTGAYRLDLGAVPADQAAAITVESSTHVARRPTAATAGQDEVRTDFVLDPLTTVRGHVVDERGLALQGVPVDVVGQDPGIIVRSRADGSFSIPIRWTPELRADDLAVHAGWREWNEAPYEAEVVRVDDIRDVRVVMSSRQPPTGSVRARVLEADSLEPVPVVAALIFRQTAPWSVESVQLDRIVGDMGSFAARGIADGDWFVSVLSTDDRVGTVAFHVGEGVKDATVDVRVSPAHTITVHVPAEEAAPASAGSFSVSARRTETRFMIADQLYGQLAGPFHSLQSIGDGRPSGASTWTIRGLLPGRWVVTAQGPGGFAERTVNLDGSRDVDVTLHPRTRDEPALLQLTGLDHRFDGPLLVRLEHEDQEPEEFVADPALGKAQTFSVECGASKLRVYTLSASNAESPSPDSVPIKQAELDLAPGETRVVTLFPR